MLRALILAAVLALGGADGEPFENRVYGHTVVVPAGWTTRLRPDGGGGTPTSRLEEARRIVASIRLTARAADVGSLGS